MMYCVLYCTHCIVSLSVQIKEPAMIESSTIRGHSMDRGFHPELERGMNYVKLQTDS